MFRLNVRVVLDHLAGTSKARMAKRNTSSIVEYIGTPRSFIVVYNRAYCTAVTHVKSEKINRK
jgi:hypothetical protein